MEFGIEKCRANLDWKTNFQESQGKSGKVLSQGKRYCFLVKSQGKK